MRANRPTIDVNNDYKNTGKNALLQNA